MRPAGLDSRKSGVYTTTMLRSPMGGPVFTEYASKCVAGRRGVSRQSQIVIDDHLGFVVVTTGCPERPHGARAAEIAATAAFTQLGLVLARRAVDLDGAAALLRETFLFAGAAIRNAAARDGRIATMRTSMAAALVVDDRWVTAQVGPVGAWIARHGRLTAVGAGAPTAGHLAWNTAPEPGIAITPLEPSDALMVGTSSLLDAIGLERVEEILVGADSLTNACDRLVMEADSAEADLDVAVVLTAVRHLAAPENA